MHSRDPGFARPLAVLVPLLFTLSCGGGDGGSTEPTPNPTPTVASLVRDTAMAGSTTFSVIVAGADFMPGVVASFDGSPRVTSRISASDLAFSLVTGDLSVPGDHEIRAKNPEPGGGPSTPFTFHVLPPLPVPTIDSLAPDTVVVGGGGFQLHVYGTSFNAQSVIRWNDSTLATVRPSATHLYASIPSNLFPAPGTKSIKAFTPAPGGGLSTSRILTIVPAPPPPIVPVISGISPDSVQVGPDTIPVLIRGTAFTGATLVDFGSQGTVHTVVPSSITDRTLTAMLDRTWLSSLGLLQVKVHATSGASEYFAAEIYNPLPTLASFTPDTLDGNALADTLVITGAGFVYGMEIRLGGGFALTSQSYVDYYHMRAVVPQATLRHGGQLAVTVHDPLEYHMSDTLFLPIRSPAPAIDSITPDPILSGSRGATVIIWGHGFSETGFGTVDGATRVTYVESDHVATVALTAAELAAPDTLTIGFQNPAPAVGPSNSKQLIVLVANAPPTIDSVVPRIVVSDSGVQTITVHGSGFLPGSQVEIGKGPFSYYLAFPLDTLATTWVSDSLLTAVVPDTFLNVGWRLDLMVRAPQPTARASDPRIVPVRTSGIRAIDSLPGSRLTSFVWDSVRGVMYAIGQDPAEALSLLALDPGTGAILRSLPLGDPSARLLLDHGNAHLYLRTAEGHLISRVDLTAWLLEWTISMGQGPGGVARLTSFVLPLAGTPGSFAVAPNLENTGRNIFTVYDDSVPRAWRDTLDFPTRYGQVFGDTVVIVTFDSVYAGVVGDSSLNLVSAVPLAQPSPAGGVFLDRDRMAFPGRLVDLRSGATVAESPNLDGTIVPGLQGDRYFVGSSGGEQFPFYAARIRRIDRTTGNLVRTVGFDIDYQYYLSAFGIDGSGSLFLTISNYPASQVVRMQTVLSDP